MSAPGPPSSRNTPWSFGGVSSRQRHPASRRADDSFGSSAAQFAATVGKDFADHGGPVISNPTVYISYWGAAWSDKAHTTRRADLEQFVKDFLASSYMNILSQYGAGGGAGKAGSVLGISTDTTVSGEISDTDIHTTIQSLINSRQIPGKHSPL